jgi:hypothetical protein
MALQALREPAPKDATNYVTVFIGYLKSSTIGKMFYYFFQSLTLCLISSESTECLGL